MSASFSAERTPPFDHAALLGTLGGDPSTLRELLLLYLEEGPRLAAELHMAAAASDGEGMRHAAHALKGTLGSLTAREASTAAEAVETLARNHRLEGAVAAVTDLDTQLQRLDAAVQAYLAGSLEP